ncbi:MAG: ribosome rescue protein RqcH, partial [Halobacteria archaeon]|nr:ribosome rescue protein RqcH [Halobacteria archaeon]
HLTQNTEDAPKRPPNLPMLMRKRLSGGQISFIEQYDFDRIVEIGGERPDGNYTMVAELFGDGNFVFLDSERKVLRALNTVRLKSRTVAPGHKYEFPPSRVSPLDISFDEFVEIMEESGTDFVRTLASQLNFGGLYAEEICKRAGVKKERSISEATQDEYKDLFEVMNDLFEPLREMDLDPHVVYQGDEPIDVLPIKLERYETNEIEEFETFNQALDSYFSDLKERRDQEDETGIEEEIEKQKRIIKQQQGAIEGFEREEESLKRKAELLYAHYSAVDDLLENIREARSNGLSWTEISETLEEGKERGIESAEIVESVNDDKGTVRINLESESIELNIESGVEKNASRLYDEAKEVQEKREGALEAMEERRETLENLKKRRDSESLSEEEGNEEQKRKIKPRGEKWYDRFRWFRTSDGFLVIGGRNADQNDEIYKKYMEKNDLFFHTQAHGGPITVLKTTAPDEPAKDIDVPDRSKRQAAQFAVSYSSVWEAGHYSGDVYSASPEQVSKTPESGEYIQKGSVVVRGERTYYRDVPVGVAVGLRLDEEAGVIGGPPEPIKEKSDYWVELEPGEYSQNDTAVKVYRHLREIADDEKLVRKFASPDKIQMFLPAGKSRIKDKSHD